MNGKFRPAATLASTAKLLVLGGSMPASTKRALMHFSTHRWQWNAAAHPKSRPDASMSSATAKSSRALPNHARARSVTSSAAGIVDKLTLAQNAVFKGYRHLSPALPVVGVKGQDVKGCGQVEQDAVEVRFKLPLIFKRLDHDRQIKVGVRALIAARSAAKQQHLLRLTLGSNPLDGFG